MTSIGREKAMTIVELMVSLVGIAVVLSALVGFVAGTLSFTTKTISSADGMQSLTQISAYLGDNLRRASTIAGAAFNLNGAPCDLTDSNNPCLAIIVPESSMGGTIDSFLLLVYKLEPRSNLDSAFKVSNNWADANTSVLMEYRTELCGPSSGLLCVGQPAVPDSITAQAYFVADYLVPADELAIPIFSYDNISKITVSLQIKASQRGKIHYTPKSPYVITVSKRN